MGFINKRQKRGNFLRENLGWRVKKLQPLQAAGGGSRKGIQRMLSLVVVIGLTITPVTAGGKQNVLALRQYFGSKTPYEPPDAVLFPSLNASRPLAIYALVRHGSRYPTRKHIEAIKGLEGLLTERAAAGGETTSEFPPELRTWRSPFRPEDSGQLMQRGWEEMYELGKRLRFAFSPVFGPLPPTPPRPNTTHLSPRLCEVLGLPRLRLDARTSRKPRAVDSGRAFVRGLLGAPVSSGPEFDIPIARHQSLLRFHKHCRKYIDAKAEIAGRDDTETRRFERNNLTGVRARVGARLGGRPLDLKDLRAMWTACRYGHEPWCAMFGDEDAAALEYAEDLISFSEKGYGFPGISRIACSLVAEIEAVVRSAGSVARLQPQPPTSLYLRFAHAETLFALAPVLGLYRDAQALDADAGPDRQWDTSSFPFGSNLVFVIQRGRTSDEPSIAVYHNERPARIPACGGGHECSMRTLLQLLEPFSSLDYETVCSPGLIKNLLSYVALVPVLYAYTIVYPVLGVFLYMVLVAAAAAVCCRETGHCCHRAVREKQD